MMQIYLLHVNSNLYLKKEGDNTIPDAKESSLFGIVPLCKNSK